ncbi:glycosyltransferase involved in cell wall biosynthesis [Salinibacter ruber]|uniref:Glycosyltransferase involved in cell wall biosynthesis n=1 Tax=Salinibacter ruber TaxID=146919 RepID=A0A9X2U2Z6_9BACT|nr:glycosyltransferase family 4 protein [Salinibacter ruber]MCS3857805.1 glycosyltransferase involved in cell wall biosynthesis [Salinibacter ruber]MCS3864631.1 glycosyltransferase involved in cell wall biosynthesis [Salinibacter ruber]
MRVVNITEEGRWGGPQSRITALASRLEEFGVSTTVVHPESDSSRMVKELRKRDVNHIPLDLTRLTKHGPTLLRYVSFFGFEVSSLCRILKTLSPDLVHCNGSWQIKGMLAARLTGVPAIWNLNDTSVPFPVRMVFNQLAPFVADGFTAVAERARKYYLSNTDFRGKPQKVIQAPVNTEEFNPENVPEHPELKEVDGLRVVTVASVNPDKGLENFIEMSARVGEEIQRKVHFFIVGPIHDTQKNYARQLRDRADRLGCRNLYFMGHSDRVEQVLKAADLYVCSSRSEASPISVWEAMAMRLPVVSTDVGDVRRFVENSEARAGSVVDVGDSEGLSKDVLRFLQDKALRHVAGENGRKIACSRLDISICARKHYEFYQNIAS